ncbi:MAG TPA: hypothetical protein VFW33_04815 [Gemmataceae bacterium]|nr:hypothetical protein [Gemmataceae bacterium]
MQTIEVDARRFFIFAPVWRILIHETDEQGKEVTKIIEDSSKSGLVYIPAFTDRDLAERAVERTGKPSAFPVEFRTPPEWLSLLEQLAREYNHLAIDPEPGQFLRLAIVADVIRVVRESIRRQDEK